MYTIIERRNYLRGTVNALNGWRVLRREICDADGFSLRQDKFASKKEALEYVDKLSRQVYYLSHGEYTVPDYRVVKYGGRFHNAARRRGGEII